MAKQGVRKEDASSNLLGRDGAYPQSHSSAGGLRGSWAVRPSASLHLLPKPGEHFPYFHGEVAHALTPGRAALFIGSTVVSTIEHSR